MDKGHAITPIDGRNRLKVEELSAYFSEFAYTKVRVFIELEYLKYIAKIRGCDLSKEEIKILDSIHAYFSDKDFKKIKKTESELNHDIKAIEYYLKDKVAEKGLSRITLYIHWGLTSEDINNLAYSILLNSFKNSILAKEIHLVIEEMVKVITQSDFVILGRTHGQIASPTLMSKELCVFLSRIIPEFKKLRELRFNGKLNGSVGTYSELYYSMENVDWLSKNNEFIVGLGLGPVELTTQILPPELTCEFFDILIRIQNILINFVQDLWLYNSIGYIKLENKIKEVGSSVMPQKINPIQLEASEGAFQLSNSLFEFYSDKFSKSRLQRDLSDSTVKRSFGFAFGYTLLGLKGLRDGLNRISFDKKFAQKELKNHQEAYLSMIQTKDRLADSLSYEKMKNKYKGKTITNGKKSYVINLDIVLNPSRELIKNTIKQFQEL